MDVQYYSCVYVFNIVYLVILSMVMCNAVYVLLCTYDVVYMVFCVYYICSTGIDGAISL